MEQAQDHYYQAMASRDRRFDGRFFTGVHTTGIYCRPICPARTPLRKNVSFYACAAAAEQAGFRACRRCRPETAPGTPGWQGTSATVQRAIDLIGTGALDDGDIGSLADRLGVGDRHLRRLFQSHLGVSPVSVAQTRRLHFARHLIDHTGLPMARVAEEAGFASVRRFNAAVLDAFGASPTKLRNGSRRTGDRLVLPLAYRPPYDFKQLLNYLRPRAIPGVEWVGESVYRRTIAWGAEVGRVEVSDDAARHRLLAVIEVPGRGRLLGLVERLKAQFDVHADPMTIEQHLGRDRKLKPLVRKFSGLRVPGGWDPFEIAVRTILGQQVSVVGATTLAGRLVERFGTRLETDRDDHPTHVFPTPSQLARADLSNIGMPGRRAAALSELAGLIASGEIDLSPGADVAKVVARMLAVKGIGPWTTSYLTMRAFAEPDAFLPSDLGIRKALSEGGKLLSTKQLNARAEAWRPWRSYAVFYLWRGLSLKQKRRK